MRQYSHLLAVAACPLLLSACGGGGTAPPPPPGPTAPTITSPASAAVVENAAGTIYQASASDPQGDAIVFDLASGSDASAFAITGGGALTFRQAPNFDLPADADGNNVYQVTLRATAGGQVATRDLAITVTNSREGIVVTRIATGLQNPVGMTLQLEPLRFQSHPVFVIAEKGGRVLELDGQTGALTELPQVAANVRPGEILDITYVSGQTAFSDGLMLLTHSPSDGILLQGYSLGSGRRFTRQIALPWSSPVEGTLFTGSGIGRSIAAIGDPSGERAQDPASGYGKLFSIEPGDPYAGASVPSGLVYDVRVIGSGIRAPSGGGRFNEQVLLADQGGSEEQELSLFDDQGDSVNLGWPFFEGTTLVRNVATPSTLLPFLAYDFGTGPRQGIGIVAGVGYSGNAPGIRGHYVFGDRNGSIFSIPYDQLTNSAFVGPSRIELRTHDFVPDVGTIDSPVAFVLSFQVLFILDSDGEVFRVTET